MRLDLFLKKCVIIKRRTIAKELVERGHVLVSDKVAKPSTEVKEGSIIELHLGTHIIVVKAHIEVRGNKEIPSFETLSDQKIGD